LVLRICVGLVTLEKSGVLLQQGSLPITITSLALVSIAAGACLVIGLMTPGAGATIAAAAVATFFAAGAGRLEPPTLSLVLGDVAALVLLGPGAYSVDARLFGRREILVDIEMLNRKQ
jgi:uncharacterized membrane protein YphA (DoxX/SURF4 family)